MMTTEAHHVLFASDAGHGWLRVRVDDIERLGIAERISGCSYRTRDGLAWWLEEDCDAGVYMQAAKAAGWEVAVEAEDHGNYSPVRYLETVREPRRLLVRLDDGRLAETLPTCDGRESLRGRTVNTREYGWQTVAEVMP